VVPEDLGDQRLSAMMSCHPSACPYRVYRILHADSSYMAAVPPAVILDPSRGTSAAPDPFPQERNPRGHTGAMPFWLARAEIRARGAVKGVRAAGQEGLGGSSILVGVTEGIPHRRTRTRLVAWPMEYKARRWRGGGAAHVARGNGALRRLLCRPRDILREGRHLLRRAPLGNQE